MTLPIVNNAAVLVTGVVIFVLGGLWYSPLLFAKRWIALVGKTEEELRATTGSVPLSYLLVFACGVLTAYVMALVVGNFSPADVPIDGVEDRFTFQTPQPTSFFPPFFAGMDALVSPNVPFRLGPGAFDGFPTGCAVEAALAGVAVFCSDELGENEWFRPDVELCLVEPRAEAVVRRVEEYRGAPARLHALAAAGQRRALELFGREAQLAPRCALLESLL